MQRKSYFFLVGIATLVILSMTLMGLRRRPPAQLVKFPGFTQYEECCQGRHPAGGYLDIDLGATDPSTGQEASRDITPSQIEPGHCLRMTGGEWILLRNRWVYKEDHFFFQQYRDVVSNWTDYTQEVLQALPSCGPGCLGNSCGAQLDMMGTPRPLDDEGVVCAQAEPGALEILPQNPQKPHPPVKVNDESKCLGIIDLEVAP